MLDNKIPVIFGCSGEYLTEQEKELFRKYLPAGYILFKRNIKDKAQVKSLVKEMREISGDNTPILIDQEGGRVARLKPPHWPEFPSMEYLVNNEANPRDAIYKNAVLLGKTLSDLNINVNCAPVCDLKISGAHDIIGDRSFGSDPILVAEFAKIMADGLRSQNIIPILKHIPGHGRAKVDSHEDLPIVDKDLATLEASDFKVFSLLKNENAWGMTAHIIYTALDSKNPATLSKKVMEYIRNNIGFKGKIISDDLSMKALKGDLGQLANKALDAGCNIVLHCNGNYEEMLTIARSVKARNNIFL